MNRRIVAPMIVVLGMLGLGAAVTLAQGGETIDWWVTASGGVGSSVGDVTMNDTIGQPLAGPSAGTGVSLSAGYWYSGLGPTGVFLKSFAAAPQGAAILVTWETSQEIDNLGFNLYRAVSEEGPMVRLNDDLIPTQVPPGSPFGAVYEWLDEDGLVPGQGYCYWLEDVDLYGRTALHGPVQATAAAGGDVVYLPLVRR